MGLCMLIVATVETQSPTLPDGSKSHSIAVAIVFLLFLFIFFYKPTWGATVWIWTSEIFSMNVRAQAVGMATQTQNVAQAIVGQFFPIFLKVSNTSGLARITSIADNMYVCHRTAGGMCFTCLRESTSCSLCLCGS